MLLRLLFEGGVYRQRNKYRHYGVCKTFVVAAAATASTMNLTSREVKARNFASLFDQEFFALDFAAHDLI